jgi:hypothetical protein
LPQLLCWECALQQELLLLLAPPLLAAQLLHCSPGGRGALPPQQLGLILLPAMQRRLLLLPRHLHQAGLPQAAA